ncbi:SgcJ/EcaC family oxidoreductase [Myroides odoratimimus]|uniref:SgcJ/EcaC family oxidoreductase n=1 Tax=Myroides odoratimimus TaxID=76832 RepID=UPI0025753EF3|nr:SgcJ/EcaC family oxidoreductase [Myroides odoratimimus]MDM1528562.1 SgcJ/EcaC family oxidoreductase [Myroides odoratimimus]
MTRQNPEEIVQQFVTAWNKYDANLLADIFVDDADFVNVIGLWWHKKEDIFKAHDYGLKVIFKESTLIIKRTKIRYLTDTIAIVHARLQLSNQSALKENETPQLRNNLFIFVTQKIENNWYCIAAQNAEIQSGKETFIKKEDGSFEAVNYNQFKSKD